ncbi:MAG: biotin transporter BioY [Nocardioidaceae bacterium]
MSSLSVPAAGGRRLVLADLLPGARLRDVALVVGAAGFVGLCAQISIPLPFTPVPLTMETFGVLLAGASLGLRRGALGMLLYLALGMVGLPWFAGHHGGVAIVHAASFGYLAGFPVAAALVGALAARGGDRTVRRTALTMALGSLVIYSFGLVWLMATLHVSLAEGLTLGVTPFLAGDLVKLAVAVGLLPTTWRLLGVAQRSDGRRHGITELEDR